MHRTWPQAKFDMSLFLQCECLYNMVQAKCGLHICIVHLLDKNREVREGHVLFQPRLNSLRRGRKAASTPAWHTEDDYTWCSHPVSLPHVNAIWHGPGSCQVGRETGHKTEDHIVVKPSGDLRIQVKSIVGLHMCRCKYTILSPMSSIPNRIVTTPRVYTNL